MTFSLKSLILENLKVLPLGPARFQATARAVTLPASQELLDGTMMSEELEEV